MSLIQSLIIGSETKKAIDVTARLAKLNRLFLSNSNKELIMLKDELDFIKEYVAMEKMRFESDTVFPFNINVNTRVKLTEWLIPPLIMQPLVENAIKHGVLVAKTAAEIVIDIQLINPSTIQIDIINTQANPTKKRNHGLGIGNQLVAERLAIFNELYHNQFEATFNYGFNDQKEYKSTIQIKQLDDKKSILSQKEVKAQILKPFETSNIEGGGK
jgi:LytS/YehU family sensor histidine kinase